MDNKDINISKSEEEALEIMENTSCITSEQLKQLEGDEECMQACSDIAQIMIEMQRKQDILAIDSGKELANFHHKRKRNNRRVVWASIAGIAAIALVILVLRTMIVPPESKTESISVFKADHIAQQVTLQIDGEKEVRSLKEVAKHLSSSAVQLSSQKIDYHRIIQTESKEIGKNKAQIHRLSIPRGETFKVVLSEGTEVFLNSDSRLVYPAVFKGKERIVSLEGEAYFKVTKDTGHPFIVKSGNIQVRVLGTEFNVRSYLPNETCVTLIEGKVAVSDTSGEQTVEIKPGQSAQLSANGAFAVNEVDIESFLYWKEGFFYFDNITLVDMMQEIGRWYNIDIEFRNSKVMELRMHFFANRHQDISCLIELLNRMERVHAHLETGKLIIE